jgi:hypothetical protein
VLPNNPNGLVLDRHGHSGIPNRLNQYYIASALAANFGRGSAVKPSGAGGKQITACAAGDRVLGVFHGVNYVDSAGNTFFTPKWVSGTTLSTGSLASAQIYDDQVSGVAGLVSANIGKLADIVIGNVNQATGNAGDQLDQTTIGTGTMFLIDDVDSQGQPLESAQAFGQYARALVRISKAYLNGGALTPES